MEFEASRGTYGSPRITAKLNADGEGLGRRRVARIMCELGLAAKRPKRHKCTTDSRGTTAIAENIVNRRFEELAPARNKLWVSDITYIRTWEGWAYLCVFVDVYSRRVVGHSLADNMETGMVLDALNMAVRRRSPPAGLIIHTDRGSQYASDSYRDCVAAIGAIRSMSRKGNCWDNAIGESFFATYKGEFADRTSWRTKACVIEESSIWIEDIYNASRLHSSIGYRSPILHELLTRDRGTA